MPLSSSPRILLFDIDGTLVNSFGGGKTAMQHTLQQAFGLVDPDVELSFGGRTDRGLVAELFSRNGLEDSAENHSTFHDVYHELLPKTLADCGGEVCPGVEGLLTRLAATERVTLSVMTGNYEIAARQKLDHFSIGGHIDHIFGGDHDPERDDLAQRAAAKIADRFGASAVTDMIVIGGTPADVRCARAIDAAVIGVCTGSGSREALADAGADIVLDDLSELDRVHDLLTGEQGVRG